VKLTFCATRGFEGVKVKLVETGDGPVELKNSVIAFAETSFVVRDVSPQFDSKVLA